MTDQSPKIFSLDLSAHNLISGEESWAMMLQKGAHAPGQPEKTKQSTLKGILPHLIDHEQASALKNNNVHHSTCLEAKVDAITGLGHKNTEIDDILDPLCNISWQDTRHDVISDMEEFGNGYLEVVRNKEGKIGGLYHVPAAHVWVFVEENATVYHFEVTNASRLATGGTKKYARFGDLENFVKRAKGRASGIGAKREVGKRKTSEIIHFPQSSNRSKHYGYISWAAAVPTMELEAILTQYQFDFFFNGGVPDGIFSVTGDQAMDTKDWTKIEEEFRSHVGLGNRRKIVLLHLAGLELKAKFDTLSPGDTGDFKDFNDTLAMKVVSAHRVPPLIAGITIPGKLGAANEMTNAMMLFQTLAISGKQKHVSKVLAQTLGHPEKNGGLALTRDMFLGVGEGDPEPDPTKGLGDDGMPATRPADNKGNGFNTILEEIDLGQADTIGKMRQPLLEAQAEGRNLDAGVKERGAEKPKKKPAK